jgi:hypothetical protein
MVRITNDNSEPSDVGAAFLRLQSEFQAKLADETLRYLRSIRGLFGPATPGTFIDADPATIVRGSSVPGGTVELTLEVENRQAVHCVVTPALSSLCSESGTTWFPDTADTSAPTLVAPGEQAELALRVPVPGNLPAGTYRGALFLQGMRWQGVPVMATIRGQEDREQGTLNGRPRDSRRRSPARRPAASPAEPARAATADGRTRTSRPPRQRKPESP